MKITNRQEAIALGLKRFFTGTPCRHGHVSERYVSAQPAGCCITCLKLRKKAGGSSARGSEGKRRRQRRRNQREAAAYKALRALGVQFSPQPEPRPGLVLMGRQEALALGSTRYFTGEPCKHGHIAERTVRGHECVKCRAASAHKNRKSRGDRRAHKQRRRQQQRIAYRAVRDLGVTFNGEL